MKEFFVSARGLLALGFGLSFVHLFWYGSVWTAWLAFVCYAPFLAWLRFHARRPFLGGYVFGLWYALLNCFWLGQFVGKWTQSALVGALAVFIVGSVWGCFYGFAAWVCKRPKLESLMYGSVVILFLVADVLRQSIPEFNFPFTPIGEPLVAYNYHGFGVVNSVRGCFMVLLVSGAISLKLDRTQRFFALMAGLPTVVTGVIPFKAPSLSGSDAPMKIALGQLGFDLAYTEEGLKPFKLREATIDLIARAKAEKADLLIFPEAVASFANAPQTVFELPDDLPILFGAQRGTSPRYQSAYLWDGKTFQHTDKTRLVVFGEYVPLRGIIPYPAGFQLPAGDLAPGDAPTPLRLPNGKTIGAMICFESLFMTAGEALRKAKVDFITIMSLDDWYMGTSAIPRLEIAARWRAVETRKWIFRVGSLGKTMVIDPFGRVRAELPTGERRLLTYELK